VVQFTCKHVTYIHHHNWFIVSLIIPDLYTDIMVMINKLAAVKSITEGCLHDPALPG
jgi:hypothetical protein